MSESLREVECASNLRTAEFRSENFQSARRRKFFRVVAKFAYPRKTGPNIAALTGRPERTVYGWLDGSSDAPWSAFVALFGEIERG